MPMPRTLHLYTMRLKAKAEHLLKHITDRKEHADLYVSFDLSVSMSGHGTLSHTPAELNGINSHSHSSSFLPSCPLSSNDSRTGLTATPRCVCGQSFMVSRLLLCTTRWLTHRDPVVQSKIDKARHTSHTFKVCHCYFPKHQLHCIIQTMLTTSRTCYPNIFCTFFFFRTISEDVFVDYQHG